MRFVLASIVALSLVGLKIQWIVGFGSAPLKLDAAEYFELGGHVAGGDLWLANAPIAYRKPGYPWMIGLAHTISSEPLRCLISIQAISRWLTVAAAGMFAWQLASLFDRPRGVIAKWCGLLAVVFILPCISAPIYVNVALTETWFTMWLMLHLNAVVAYVKDPQWRWSVAAAGTFAMTLLVRPIVTWLWLPHVLFGLWHWISRSQSTSKWSSRFPKQGLQFIAMTMLVLGMTAPWLLRNQRQFGEAFITKFVGRNLWIVTFQPQSGAGLSIADTTASRSLLKTFDLTPELANAMPMSSALDSWRHTWTTHRSLETAGIQDPQIDDLMKAVATQSIANQPRLFAWKALRRSINFWRTPATSLPISKPKFGHDHQSGLRTWINLRLSQSVSFNSIVLLSLMAAIIALVLSTSTRSAGIWLAGVLSYFCVVTGCLEIPDYRYRMVLEPVVASVIAVALGLCFSRIVSTPVVSPQDGTG
ncbi:MAG: hypothetical protein AAF539_04125 [Planctomycetota bacterium]